MYIVALVDLKFSEEGRGNWIITDFIQITLATLVQISMLIFSLEISKLIEIFSDQFLSCGSLRSMKLRICINFLGLIDFEFIYHCIILLIACILKFHKLWMLVGSHYSITTAVIIIVILKRSTCIHLIQINLREAVKNTVIFENGK